MGKQSNRANPQVSSVEDYYRVTVFMPFIDNFISQLTTRFLNHKSVIEGKSIFYCLSLSQKSDQYSVVSSRKLHSVPALHARML